MYAVCRTVSRLLSAAYFTSFGIYERLPILHGFRYWQSSCIKRAFTYEEVLVDTFKTKLVQGFYDSKNVQGLQSVWNALIYTHHQPRPEHYQTYVEDMLTQRNLAEVYHALNVFNISAVNHEVAKGTHEVQQITIPVLVLRGIVIMS